MKHDDKLPTEFQSNNTPLAVVEDQYYPPNEFSRQKEHELKGQIVELSKELLPWEIKACKRYANGDSINAIAKDLKKSFGATKSALSAHVAQQVVELWRAVHIYQEGPNEAQRKNMLWRIAVDNEKEAPKEARGAIEAINRMIDSKNGRTGNRIEIVINNELLPRTKLDG